MQAFANNDTDKMEKSVDLNKDSIELMDNHAPLFSTDEIIFPDDNVERPYTRYGYKVSKMNFLVPEKTVSEVIQNPNIFFLPNSPAWIEGLINIRGNIIPVMNIDKLLKNLKSEKLTTVLVLNKSDKETTIAIMISDLPVSLELSDTKTKINDYPDVLHDFIDNGFNQNNTDWIEFNPQKLFKKMAGK